jgi:hypothetical protein
MREEPRGPRQRWIIGFWVWFVAVLFVLPMLLVADHEFTCIMDGDTQATAPRGWRLFPLGTACDYRGGEAERFGLHPGVVGPGWGLTIFTAALVAFGIVLAVTYRRSVERRRSWRQNAAEA